MKTIKITYQCDYCKEIIDTDSDTIRAILPGRIGYQDSFLPDSEEDIRHYHDYCLEHLLTLHFEENQEEPEPEMEPEPEQESEPKEKKKVDHDRIVALYRANPPRSVAWIADDVGCSTQTVINHLTKEGIYEGRRL